MTMMIAIRKTMILTLNECYLGRDDDDDDDIDAECYLGRGKLDTLTVRSGLIGTALRVTIMALF